MNAAHSANIETSSAVWTARAFVRSAVINGNQRSPKKETQTVVKLFNMFNPMQSNFKISDRPKIEDKQPLRGQYNSIVDNLLLMAADKALEIGNVAKPPARTIVSSVRYAMKKKGYHAARLRWHWDNNTLFMWVNK